MGTILTNDDGPVRTLTLNRPEKLNALNDELRAELQHAVDETAEATDIRVVVLRGAGRAFSAGADLRGAPPAEASESPRTALEQRRANGRWQRLLDDIERLPQVTVAALHGHVIGGAALLAVACDLRVAADDLQFRIPELEIGIPLTWAGLPRLAREIGLSRTRDLVMTGRTVTATEAADIGLVHRTAPAGQGQALDDTLTQLIETLVAQPPLPLALTVDGLRALGRTLAPQEQSWADADLLRWSLREQRQR